MKAYKKTFLGICMACLLAAGLLGAPAAYAATETAYEPGGPVKAGVKTCVKNIIAGQDQFGQVCPFSPEGNPHYLDNDGDGICDYADCRPHYQDSNGDGVCDYGDCWSHYLDNDGDGICDYPGCTAPGARHHSGQGYGHYYGHGSGNGSGNGHGYGHGHRLAN